MFTEYTCSEQCGIIRHSREKKRLSSQVIEICFYFNSVISQMFARFNFLQEPFHMSFTCAEGESERSASKLECLSDVLQTSEALPLLCVQKSKILFKKMSD